MMKGRGLISSYIFLLYRACRCLAITGKALISPAADTLRSLNTVGHFIRHCCWVPLVKSALLALQASLFWVYSVGGACVFLYLAWVCKSGCARRHLPFEVMLVALHCLCYFLSQLSKFRYSQSHWWKDWVERDMKEIRLLCLPMKKPLRSICSV